MVSVRPIGLTSRPRRRDSRDNEPEHLGQRDGSHTVPEYSWRYVLGSGGGFER